MKDAFYFSHDTNARNDEKIVSLRMDHGMEGYGVYFSIIEMLSESSGYKLDLNCKRIAFALQTQVDVVDNVINGHDLFIIDGDKFYSESLMARMKIKESKSKKARESAKARWDKQKKAPTEPTVDAEPPTTNEDTVPPEEPKEKKFQPKRMELPDDVSRDVWNEWLDKRVRLGASNTERALKAQLNKIPALLKESEIGTTANNLIEASIDNGWKKLVANKQIKFGYNQKEDKGLHHVLSNDEMNSLTEEELFGKH